MLKEIKNEHDVITNVDLFNEIILKVKESGKWPDDLIDYSLASTYDKTGLYNYAFEPCFVLKAGGSEGYYLDLAIHGRFTLTDAVNTLNLGTIKTLYETEEDIRRMAALYAECLIAYEKIMSENLDSFTRNGCDLHFMDENGNLSNWGYSGIKEKETALEQFHKYHEMEPVKCAKAVIRNNMTREEKIYE